MPDSSSLLVTGNNILVIDVEDRSGNTTNDGPILTALNFAYNDPLSAVAQFTFSMPANDTRINDITLKKSVLRFYVDGAEVFLGVPEKKTETVNAAGVVLANFTGRSLLVEMTEQTTRTTDSGSINRKEFTNSNALPNNITIDVAINAETWALDTTNGFNSTVSNIYYRTNDNSALAQLASIGQFLNEDFYYRPPLSGDDRELIWIRGAGSAQRGASGYRAVQTVGNPEEAYNNPTVCFIQNLRIVEDSAKISNRIYPWGAGNAESRLNLKASDWRTRNITNISKVAAPGTTVTVVCDSGVANNTLAVNDWIYIDGTTNYEGHHQIASIATTNVTNDTITYVGPNDTSPGAETAGVVHNFKNDQYVVVTNRKSGNTQRVNYIEDIALTETTLFGGDSILMSDVYGSQSELYVVMEKNVQFLDISPTSNSDENVTGAANTLLDAGINYLKRYGKPKTFYELEVTGLQIDYTSSSGLHPGQTIKVIYEDENHTIDDDFYVLDIRTDIATDGAKNVQLLIGEADRMPDSDVGSIVESISDSTIYRTSQQIVPAIIPYSYSAVPFANDIESSGDNIKAALFFPLPDSITTIDKVYLYYQITALRSTVQGGTSATSEDSDPTHDHSIPINDAVPDYTLGYSLSAGVAALRNDGNPGTLYTDSQTAGDMDHSHTVTATLQYGLYEDATYTTDNDGVTIKYGVNVAGATTTVTGGAAWSGSDWHRVDVTSYVRDAGTLRPKNDANTFTIEATSTNDGGEVTAIIEVRCTIQSITYS